MDTKKTFAILTGGGDAPGLNAVIRGVAKTLLNQGCTVYGSINGFNGLVNDRLVLLDYARLSGILPRGGTVLGTTNRDNPFRFAMQGPEGLYFEDRRQTVVDNLKKRNVEALVVIGGDGSLAIGAKLAKECGINVVGCPKTIDNDILGTERTFGFDTAMATATDALDRLHTTAESHHRVMVLEVMGRYAGWIALHSGIAGGADVILLPEIPYRLEKIVEKIQCRKAAGKAFSIVVVAEGAKPEGGELSVARVVKESFDTIRLGGAGDKVAKAIEAATGIETRTTVLGYLQRGGSPTPFDRVLATRYGVAAALNCLEGKYNVMMSLQNDMIVPVDLQIAGSGSRNVPLDFELIKVGRALGLSFGD